MQTYKFRTIPCGSIIEVEADHLNYAWHKAWEMVITEKRCNDIHDIECIDPGNNTRKDAS